MSEQPIYFRPGQGKHQANLDHMVTPLDTAHGTDMQNAPTKGDRPVRDSGRGKDA
jgi:hypothetical protein